jgi:hypothetical protein
MAAPGSKVSATATAAAAAAAAALAAAAAAAQMLLGEWSATTSSYSNAAQK